MDLQDFAPLGQGHGRCGALFGTFNWHLNGYNTCCVICHQYACYRSWMFSFPVANLNDAANLIDQHLIDADPHADFLDRGKRSKLTHRWFHVDAVKGCG